MPFDMFSFLGASHEFGLYVQFRVMRYKNGTHYPIVFTNKNGKKSMGTFWTDRPLLNVNPEHVYFYSPALRPFGSVLISGSFVAWLDFDMEMPSDWHIFPSLIVSTGGGHHVYWRFDDFLFPECLSSMLNRLVDLYPLADPVARDITRFLRWPGTYNLKYSPARQCEIVNCSEKVYSYDEVMAL